MNLIHKTDITQNKLTKCLPQ